MAQVNPPQCGDGARSADALAASSQDQVLDRWLSGRRPATLDEFRAVWRRLDAESRRLREEGRKLRETIRGSG